MATQDDAGAALGDDDATPTPEAWARARASAADAASLHAELAELETTLARLAKLRALGVGLLEALASGLAAGAAGAVGGPAGGALAGAASAAARSVVERVLVQARGGVERLAGGAAS